jgi:hypothetical protein
MATDGRTFSIVKFDWDFPPYLRPVNDRMTAMPFQQRMALSKMGQQLRSRWRIELQPLSGVPNAPTGVLAEASVDGRPIFSSEALAIGGPMAAVAVGDHLNLRLQPNPAAGKVRLTINDFSEVFDFERQPPEAKIISLFSAEPDGTRTAIPNFAPGIYVETALRQGHDGPEAEVSYRYTQQDSRPERGTVLRLYHEDDKGGWHLQSATALRGAQAMPVRLPLPRGWQGQFQISVAPATDSKTGPEYFGLPFEAQRLVELAPGAPVRLLPESVQPSFGTDLPYGNLQLEIRFPTNRLNQAEPIVATGVEEAGDFLYVIYSDSKHVRLGLDHWFKGGPLTPPLAIDYAQAHRLEISMGSLLPPAEDILFAGMTDRQATALKHTIKVVLDGVTVIDAASDFYESPPELVSLGENRINGTSSGLRFTGKILRHARVWPGSSQ